jgi:uncharacterized protein YbjT (DUF2867 family)
MNLLLFGATGTAGGAVLKAALADPAVTEVRAPVRQPHRMPSHPNCRVISHADFLDYTPLRSALAGLDACFFCLGVSVRQVSAEPDYRRITMDFPLAAATALRQVSPGATFHYLSGQGAGTTSRFMWARVKGEAEQALIARFDAVCWRPAFIDGADSAGAPRLYQKLRPVFRLLRVSRSLYVSGEDLGRAMLRATQQQMRGQIVENVDIRRLADESRTRRP